MRSSFRLRLVALASGAALATSAAGAALAAQWDAGAGKDWETLLAAAKKEGTVVVHACPGGMVETIGRMFKEDTGINISFVTGTIGELNAKFETEMQTGRVATDVKLAAMSPLPWAKRGELVAIKDSLMLPGVTNPSVWFGGKLSYADATEKFMPIPAEYAGGRPLINADLVAANAITTWDDLLKPQFKGKIAAIDPTDGGIGTTAAEYIAKAKGVEFIARLFKEQNVTLVTDRRQLVEAVTRGVYAIALGADAAPEIETFRQAGVTSLKVLALKDGPGNLNGGCSVTSVPVKAPHPNAALVFANWFLSVRGQEAYALGQHQPSNRSDVSKAGVQVNLIPEPGVDYFSTYRENFFVNERTALDAAIAKAIGK